MNVLIVVIATIIAIAIFTSNLNKYRDRLAQELPWRQWLSIEELVTAGYSRFYSKLVLPALYNDGRLAIRLKENITQNEWKYVLNKGFGRSTIRFCDFQLIRRVVLEKE